MAQRCSLRSRCGCGSERPRSTPSVLPRCRADLQRRAAASGSWPRAPAARSAPRSRRRDPPASTTRDDDVLRVRAPGTYRRTASVASSRSPARYRSCPATGRTSGKPWNAAYAVPFGSFDRARRSRPSSARATNRIEADRAGAPSSESCERLLPLRVRHRVREVRRPHRCRRSRNVAYASASWSGVTTTSPCPTAKCMSSPGYHVEFCCRVDASCSWRRRTLAFQVGSERGRAPRRPRHQSWRRSRSSPRLGLDARGPCSCRRRSTRPRMRSRRCRSTRRSTRVSACGQIDRAVDLAVVVAEQLLVATDPHRTGVVVVVERRRGCRTSSMRVEVTSLNVEPGAYCPCVTRFSSGLFEA